jgi:flagella basal body P-ring formation protein FlgA
MEAMMRRFICILRVLRPALAGAALAAAAALSAAPPAAAADGFQPLGGEATRVSLRTAVEVDDGVVRLGDLFTNAGEHAAQAVAYAPEPGDSQVFDARWLAKAASYYRLDWEPESYDARALVTRSATAYTAADVAEAVKAALAEYDLAGETTVELDNPLMRFHVPGERLGGVAVETIRYDRNTGRFAAIIQAPAGDPQAKRMRISGRSFRVLQIPVLAERLMRGDVISERDIVWTGVKAERLQTDVITDAADLIGMAPRRGLRAGVPVREADVQKPLLVKRGSTVTIRLSYGAMSLSAQGKALQHGSKGDVIQISNSQSNQVIEAEVVGAGLAAVRLDRALTQTAVMN